MGSGIAQTAAQSGFSTILYDLDPAVLERAKLSIENGLRAFVEKGKMTPDEKEQAFGRIQFTAATRSCVADIFIEAIIEDLGAKVALFKQLDELNPGRGIFASNTSSLSIAAIAAQTANPGRVVGMHFFNPAPLMKLVEVVETDQTDKSLVRTVIELAERMGKTAVKCRDAPGFIVNRVARPFYIESLRIAEQGLAGFDAIDRVLEGAGFKMGPFRLMDLIGNDINFAVSNSVYERLGRPDRLVPSHIQAQKVRQGMLGKKTGEGYYKY
jgi:3-hydroxybutyryl-CoA dehydrogenase